MRAVPTFPSDKITVIAWPDEVIDAAGHDARARYVETYWLGVLGPSTTFLLRYLADELEASPSGFVMHYAEVAARMGVAWQGKNAPFTRALARLCQFEMAQLQQTSVLGVRRRVPTLSRRHLARLTDHLRSTHQHYLQQHLTSAI